MQQQSFPPFQIVFNRDSLQLDCIRRASPWVVVGVVVVGELGYTLNKMNWEGVLWATDGFKHSEIKQLIGCVLGTGLLSLKY